MVVVDAEICQPREEVAVGVRLCVRLCLAGEKLDRRLRCAWESKSTARLVCMGDNAALLICHDELGCRSNQQIMRGVFGRVHWSYVEDRSLVSECYARPVSQALGSNIPHEARAIEGDLDGMGGQSSFAANSDARRSEARFAW